MVVGEIASRDDLRPDPPQRGVEFLRPGNAREGDDLAADQRRCGERVGLEARADKRLAGRHGGDSRRRRVVAPQHDQRPHERELRRNRRAQRTSRNAEAVAEARLAVHDGKGEVLDEPGVLQAVVKNENIRAGFDRASRASDPIRPDPARRELGQQQRLVADHRRGMRVRVDEERLDAFVPAIAARQEGDASAIAGQHPRQRQRRRRLARAASHEIADADRRRADALACPRMRRAVVRP